MSENYKGEPSDGLVSTGIKGLDAVLCGGLPANQIYLVKGRPGCGKTTLALQFVLEGVKRGERCVYATRTETKEQLIQVAESHGWSLEGVEISDLTESREAPATASTFFHTWETELALIQEAVREQIERVKPARMVFDSLAEVRFLADSPYRFREQVGVLRDLASRHHCTMLFLDETGFESGGLDIETRVHGVISLEQRTPDYGVTRRRLIVPKLRGISYREGYHDFVLRRGGVQVFPRLIAAEHFRQFRAEQLSSDIEILDQMLGGGLDRGTSTMVLGQTGTGKTTLMQVFAAAAAGRGEKALICSFDEDLGSIVHRGDQLGLRFSEHIRVGKIELRKFDPAELSPGEFADWLQSRVEQDRVQLVIMDTLNGYMKAMPEENALDLQMHELVTYMAQQGVASLQAMDLHGILPQTAIPPVDLSYIADNLILLRYFEAFGKLQRAISVIKKRGGAHESSIREFVIDQTGIHFGQPLEQFQGVLSGLPQFTGSREALMERTH